jgi:hypothetical protein
MSWAAAWMLVLGGKVIGVRLMSWRTGVVIKFKAGSLLEGLCMKRSYTDTRVWFAGNP